MATQIGWQTVIVPFQAESSPLFILYNIIEQETLEENKANHFLLLQSFVQWLVVTVHCLNAC